MGEKAHKVDSDCAYVAFRVSIVLRDELDRDNPNRKSKQKATFPNTGISDEEKLEQIITCV